MLELVLVSALILVVGSGWIGGLHYGFIGVLPATVAAVLLVVIHYRGQLYPDSH
jgi:hypothetical protein